MSSNEALLAAAVLGLMSGTAFAVEDLGALEVVGQRGQSVEQARRDRYECHNWAVEQTGASPAAVQPGGGDREAEDAARGARRERVDRAIAGAVIGAGVGGLFGGGRRHDVGDRVLVGAAAGAAIGAATAKSRERGAAGGEEAVQPSDYLRALTACLEGRGYAVRMPTPADFAANRSR